MKKVTAYYSDYEGARAAAYNIDNTDGSVNEIFLGSDKSNDIGLFNYTLAGGYIGAVLGSALGILMTQFPTNGFLSAIAPLSGLITGTVTGSVCGALIDTLNYEYSPDCALVTVSVSEKNLGKLLYRLKKHGAGKITLH